MIFIPNTEYDLSIHVQQARLSAAAAVHWKHTQGSLRATCPCASCGRMCETIINRVVDIDSTATPSCTRFAGCYLSRCWSAPDMFGSDVYQEPRTINQVNKDLLLMVTMVRGYGPDGSLVLALVYICKIRCMSTIDQKGEC